MVDLATFELIVVCMKQQHHLIKVKIVTGCLPQGTQIVGGPRHVGYYSCAGQTRIDLEVRVHMGGEGQGTIQSTFNDYLGPNHNFLKYACFNVSAHPLEVTKLDNGDDEFDFVEKMCIVQWTQFFQKVPLSLTNVEARYI